MRTIRQAIGLALCTAMLAACAGTSGPGGIATSTAAAAELPARPDDFDRVCETQIGFAGAAAYDATPGLHPVALFEEGGDPPSLSQSSRTLPAGWTVQSDSDYASSSEFAAVQLVACARLVETKPGGTCEFKGEDGAPPSVLEQVDATFELSLYAAKTGEAVGTPQTLVAAPTECPMFALIREGQTKLWNGPTDEQYINALKPFVMT